MANNGFTENDFEQALIALFTERLGYDYECGYDVERDTLLPRLMSGEIKVGDAAL